MQGEEQQEDSPLLGRRWLPVFSTRLRQVRAQAGLSQEQLAERIGTTCSSTTISRWERGLTFPLPHYRQRLCQVLDTTPQQLGLVPEAEEAKRIIIVIVGLPLKGGLSAVLPQRTDGNESQKGGEHPRE